MNILIVFSCLVVAIMAKPQGYAYSQPPTPVIQPAVYQTQQTYQAPQTLVEQPAVYRTQPTYQAPIVTSTVHKHVYVHVAPVDHEELAEQQSLAPIINHQKHYKIIFIKAPTSQSISQQLVQQQQNINEEKTIVYVLVKKPESLTEIQQTQSQVQVPSKPEVYFIKYKTEKEHIHAAEPIALPAPLPIAETPIVVANDSYVKALPEQPISVIEPRHPSPVYGPSQ